MQASPVADLSFVHGEAVREMEKATSQEKKQH